MKLPALAAIIFVASTALAQPASAPPPQWKVLNDQAFALLQQGDTDGAAAAMAKALDAATAALGPDHARVATIENNLGALYRMQKKYAQAEPLYLHALASREKALGPEDPLVAVTLANLAALHDAQDHFEQAEQYYKRALAIREKALGAEHADTLALANSLAELYMEQRRYEKAEPLLQRVYAARARTLKPEDADLRKTKKELWTLYVSTGEYGRAGQYAQEGDVTPSEEDRRRLLGAVPSAKGTIATGGR